MRFYSVQNSGKNEIFTVSTDGVGKENNIINEDLDALFKHFIRTESNRSYIEIINELINIYYTSYSPNWDGYSAEPITAQSLIQAFKFIDTIPSSIPFPEFSPHPDGHFTCEWYSNKNKMFVVNLIGNNNFVYFGIFTKDHRTRGIEYFDKELPSSILEYLRRVNYDF